MDHELRHSSDYILYLVYLDFMRFIVEIEWRDELVDTFIREETFVIRVILDTLGHSNVLSCIRV